MHYGIVNQSPDPVLRGGRMMPALAVNLMIKGGSTCYEQHRHQVGVWEAGTLLYAQRKSGAM